MALNPPRSRILNSQPATHGSATQLDTPSNTNDSPLPRTGTLRLRAEEVVDVDTDTSAHSAGEGPSGDTGRRIRWAEDVVDNEGLGRKSSKVCCIYHPTRAVGESSSDDDSSSSDSDSDSSDSESDSDIDDGAARRIGGAGGGRGKRGNSNQGHGHDHDHDHSRGGGKKKSTRKPSPNAYERMPKANPPNGAPSGRGGGSGVPNST